MSTSGDDSQWSTPEDDPLETESVEDAARYVNREHTDEQ